MLVKIKTAPKIGGNISLLSHSYANGILTLRPICSSSWAACACTQWIRYGLLLQISHVAWSACVCVCALSTGTRASCTKTAEPIEMPVWVDSFGSKELIFHGCQDLHGKGQYWRLFGQPKSIGSLTLCCGICSKRDHSIFNNGKTARLQQPNAMLPTGRCHISSCPVKNPPLRCGLSSECFDHLIVFSGDARRLPW